MVRKGGFEPPRLAAPPPQDGASASSATSAGGKKLKPITNDRTINHSIYSYFEGAGATGAGVVEFGAAGAGLAGPGITGSGVPCFGDFENCCNIELPVTPAVVFWCMVNAIDVIMNITAHQVVALVRKVAAPRGPKAV
jgi:hypothetical protein